MTDRAEARRLRGEGLALAAIGERLGVSKATVSRWLRTEDPVPRLTAEELREHARLGRTVEDVARCEKVDASTVRYHAERAGVELAVDRPGVRDALRRRPSGVETENLRRWYGDGESVAKIAARMGVSETTANRRLVRAGVRLRPPGARRAGGAPPGRTAKPAPPSTEGGAGFA